MKGSLCVYIYISLKSKELNGHFKDKKNANDLIELIIKEKSTQTPKENHHSVETFIEAVNKDVELATTGKPKKP